MNYKGLETLYWVVRLSSFNKAAIQLNTTQSSVSQRIATLEHEFGVKLLERTSRSIHLTDQGKVAFKYAEKSIVLHEQLLTDISHHSLKESTIRLGVAETIVHSWLVDFIEMVYRDYPYITIDIIVNITPVLKDALKNGELDMVFMLDHTCDFDCIQRPLCYFEQSFLISAKLGQKFLHRSALCFKDIIRSTIISYPKNTYPYIDLKQQLNQLRLPEPKTITSYSLATLIKMTEEGMGIGVLPHLSVLKELREKRLYILPTNIVLNPYHFSCVYTLGRDDLVKNNLADLAVNVANQATKKLNQQFSHENFSLY
ncbi:LysR family transcriptional regulator [Acinetobacter sp. B5B]|uniref:LysR family transcriptional regulator n=1 Tax=Acinetobacter baretiae TaxID=2605383 RepID=UPI0018C2E49C|nr:LysR family transcriptional regulator [Acinetobacter baretiae]MBF7682637.1 LysR family transcriptional regulator [Acinetobacter baretiae]MBF7685615.1 LysR family transcriptional regulator [Acinetobacter baretiae]